MIDLRCFQISRGHYSLLIRCRHCSAGWLADPGGHNPEAMIEHAKRHQRKTSRLDQLATYIAATRAAMADVEAERSMSGDNADATRALELELFAGWLDALRRERSWAAGAGEGHGAGAGAGAGAGERLPAWR